MDKLQGLCPPFATAIREFVTEANYLKIGGMPIDVESGYRSMPEQAKLYALGRTAKNVSGASPERPMGSIITNAKPGYSLHN